MTQATRRAPGSSSPALSSAIAAVLATASAAAAAQESTALGEVIVTATRRAERLQDVSESISAFDSQAIAIRGLQQMDDLVKYIPGMSMAQREPGGTTLVFRGVASSGIQYGGVSSSALYLDEQPITQSGRDPDPRLIDIERVEALRGPQGTLYGASSQSGTLRIITAKPDPSAFDAWAEAQVNTVHGGSEGYDISAMLNIPLSGDRMALRLVGFSSEDAGYIDNVLSDSPAGTFDNAALVDKDVNKIETTGARAALRFNATDNFDLTLGAIYQDMESNASSDVNSRGGDLGQQQIRFSPESVDDRWYQLALTANAKLGAADLIVSASYFDRKFAYEADATTYEFSFQQSGYVIYDFGGDPHGFATNHEDTEIKTFEARLQSSNDDQSRWSWLAGVFYSKETGHTEFDSFVDNYSGSEAFAYFDYYQYEQTGEHLAPTDLWFLGRYDTELDQKAVFGEIGFDLTENFTITAGGRWFDYDRKFHLHQESPEGFTADAPFGPTLTEATTKTNESGEVWKLNLTYRFDPDRMMYFTYSEGFRVGGSNPVKSNSILPRDFRSDTLRNFELGAKTEWLDNRVRLNIAAYLMKWDDFAVQIEDPQNGGQDENGDDIPSIFQLGYVNLPSAEIKGVESELSIALSEAWQVDATLGYNNAKVSQATVLSLEDDLGRTFDFPVTKGARLPLTPKYSASLGIEYRSPGRLMNAQPYGRVDFGFLGKSVNNLEGLESIVGGPGARTQDEYQTMDFRVGLDGEHWSAALYVDNVFDRRAVTFRNNRWATPRFSILRPRTIGLQFHYDF